MVSTLKSFNNLKYTLDLIMERKVNYLEFYYCFIAVEGDEHHKLFCLLSAIIQV